MSPMFKRYESSDLASLLAICTNEMYSMKAKGKLLQVDI